MKKPEVSVVISAYNEQDCIAQAIKSVLNQTYKNFELIIIDDCSTDKTAEIIKNFKDKRIIYLKNYKNLGIAKARNIGLKKAIGKYIFITDSDCVADKNWIKEGLNCIRREKCSGVEGLIYYISRKYKPTYCDKNMSNKDGGKFLTGNVMYRKDILKKINYADERFEYCSDRTIGLNFLKNGRLVFCKKMIVTHSKDEWNIKDFFKSAKRAKSKVILFKYYNDKSFIFWRIIYPEELLAILFPPLIFLSFFRNRYKTWKDFRLFLVLYPKLLYARYIIWKTAIKERVFLI